MAVLSSCACADWLLLAVTLAALTYTYLTWTFSYWKKRGVPYVEPQLLFGNIKDSIMVKKSMGEMYQDLYNKLKGEKYGGYFKFRQPVLMVRDPEMIKAVLVKDFASFHDNDFLVTVEDDPMLGRNPFCLQGDRWKLVRSQLTPAFTAAKVRPLFPLINEVCTSLKKYLENNEHAVLEAKEISAKFTTDVVATCTFGLNGNSFTDPNAEFRQMGRRILEPSFWKNFQNLIIIFLPPLARFFKLRFFDETVANFFRSVVKEAMSYRERNNVSRNDFLQLLMQLKAKGSVDGDVVDTKREKFTDEDVAAHATTFFSDGFETSSTTMAHALYELALNKKVLDRLRAEVDAGLKKHGGITYEMLHELTYMDLVLEETLRKNSPAYVLMRLCTKPYELPTPSGGTYTVEVGTPVLIPVWALHYDPEYFPDPERFDPERFTEENKEKRSKYVYLPFGEGPRICLGVRFALTQTKAGLTAILKDFDFTMNKRTCVPMQPDPTCFLLAAKGGIWLNFSKREDNT